MPQLSLSLSNFLLMLTPAFSQLSDLNEPIFLLKGCHSQFLGIKHYESHWFMKVFCTRFTRLLSQKAQRSAQLYGIGISMLATSKQLEKQPSPGSLSIHSDSSRKIASKTGQLTVGYAGQRGACTVLVGIDQWFKKGDIRTLDFFQLIAVPCV